MHFNGAWIGVLRWKIGARCKALFVIYGVTTQDDLRLHSFEDMINYGNAILACGMAIDISLLKAHKALILILRVFARTAS